MLDARKLRMLAELDRLGTVAEVARTLHLTGPGVSMQIAALEREVGLCLTERHGRRLALTPAGKLLAAHGHDIVGRLSLAQVEVAALLQGTAGTYRVASFASAARTIVATAWRAVLADPSTGLKLHVMEMESPNALVALGAGEIELAIVHAYSIMPRLAAKGLVATQIASEPVFIAVQRGTLPEGERVDLRDFASHDWIVPPPASSCYEMIQRASGLAGFVPRAVADASDFGTILALVAAGAGVGIVPQLAIGTLPAAVTLHPLVDPVFRHDFVVTREASRSDAGTRRLVTILADAAKTHGVPPLTDKRRRS